jgi:predicted metal-dependent TIM-barrel fold hydrolase
MDYIDIHAHMVSRSTDDYTQMALTGCIALTEPAFWAGWDRSSADGFEDYFRQLTEFEPKRAAQFGIRHYAWLCLNPKEGDDRHMAKSVLERIPRFLDRPTVLGIGEIGMNRVTRNEVATFRDHVEMALHYDQLIHIHTPHLEDKYKGTKVTVDTLLSYDDIIPSRVMVDHAEEHTIEMILGNGFWTGLTLYPQTKVSMQRAVDMIEMYGPDRICVASACDWGPSVPIAVPQFMMEMRRRRHSEDLIRKIVFENPVEFLSQCPKFELPRSRDKSAVLVAGV